MKSDRSSDIQFAALPWRRDGSHVSILLLTSRETKRWVIPKGWPMQGRQPPEAAQMEAFEEAGVDGRMSEAIGVYCYDKRMKDGALRALTVEVYPLEVVTEHLSWPEAAERTRQWFSATDAANAVDEPDLADLIRIFSAGSAPPRT